MACLEVSQKRLVARTMAKTGCHQKHPKGGGTSMNECCLIFTAKSALVKQEEFLKYSKCVITVGHYFNIPVIMWALNKVDCG